MEDYLILSLGVLFTYLITIIRFLFKYVYNRNGIT